MNGQAVVWALSAIVALAGPLAWGLVAAWRSRRVGMRAVRPAWSWRAMAGSALLCGLAFNLTFLVQELFLVLPKAFVPGLHPTLFHNNHRWTGDHPLAALFQGTGALATFVLGLVCLWRARRSSGRTPARRMALVWMAFCGLLMALPQVAIGALSDFSDVGMAMVYLRLTPAARVLAACIGLLAIPLVAWALVRPVLETADDVRHAEAPSSRAWLMFQRITLPGLLAALPILAYRVPREWLEVVLLPVLVIVPGVLWMQAFAWHVRPPGSTMRGGWPVAALLVAAIMLLVVFQGLLRPGIAFY